MARHKGGHSDGPWVKDDARGPKHKGPRYTKEQKATAQRQASRTTKVSGKTSGTTSGRK